MEKRSFRIRRRTARGEVTVMKIRAREKFARRIAGCREISRIIRRDNRRGIYSRVAPLRAAKKKPFQKRARLFPNRQFSKLRKRLSGFFRGGLRNYESFLDVDSE